MHDAVPAKPVPGNTTLGILAGGRASRLGGLDKAWLVRDAEPQVLRCQRAFGTITCATLVSANRSLTRYHAHGISAVSDSGPGDRGPSAGLEALAGACLSDWLLTVPVDLLQFDPFVARRMMDEAGATGAFARDAEGVQPLVALWNVAALRAALPRFAGRAVAVQALQADLRMHEVAFIAARFGNLNTPADLRAAGIDGSTPPR